MLGWLVLGISWCLGVGGDARWLVKVRIKSVERSAPLFSKDELVSFVVHSPAQTLGPSGGIDVETREYRGARGRVPGVGAHASRQPRAIVATPLG